jgi:hypothetical protein
MRKAMVWIAVVGVSVGGTCQRPVSVGSDPTRPDPSRVRESEAAIRADLEELIHAQDVFWRENDHYTLEIERLAFTPSPGVIIDILDARRGGFSAIGTEEMGGAECAVFVGSVDPPRSYVRSQGVVACRR